ncbi:MAG: AgmX/PglI C-terminal domain-containing protein [Proteobacteria bacterium]|nr:AgmX/PglI C-terminal domain-containing protein [Pseudomonadota bacterium]
MATVDLPEPRATVLRLGVLREGKLVEQRLIAKGRTVTIGSDIGATLSYAESGCEGSHALFTEVGGHRVLRISASMGGRLASGEGRASLASLRQDPSVTKRGEHWLVPLTDADAGKLTIGEVTVLFQFAPAPPKRQVVGVQGDFRPRLIEEDDPLYLGTLGTSAAMAGILAVFVGQATVAESTLDDLPERFRRPVFAPTEIAELVVEPQKEQEPPKPVEDPEPAPVEQVAATPETPPSPQAEQAVIEELKVRSAMIRHIYSRGDGIAFAGGPDTAMDELDGYLDNLDGKDVRMPEPGGTREGTADREDADIEQRRASSGSSTLEQVDSTFTGTVTIQPPQGAELEGAEAISATIAKNQGAMTYCFQRHSKANPGLSGRVEIDVVLRKGRPTAVEVGNNGTGDSAFAECLVGKVRTWKFGSADTAGDIVSLPFVFSPQ